MVEKLPDTKTTPFYWQLLAGILWLVSGAGGIYTVYSFFKLSSLAYSFLGKDYYTGVLVGQVSTLIAGFGCVAMLIITGEYHLKHAGERRSWMIFGWVLGVELVICLAGLLIG